MRHFFVTFLLILTLILPSCTVSQDDTDRLAEHLASLDAFSAEVLVTADLTDRTSSFRLDCTVSGETCTVAVTEPASLEGISVAIEPGGCTVSYDGASFSAGDPDALGVSAVTVVAELARLWRSASPRESGAESMGETDCILSVYASGADETRVLFDAQTLSPLQAEFYRNGARSLLCEFVSFTTGGN